LNLSCRLGLYIGCIVLLGTVLLGYHNSVFHSGLVEDTGVNEAERLGRLIFENLYTSMMLGGGKEETMAIIERIRGVEGIEEVRIIRGQAVSRQFGIDVDRVPLDELDRAALMGSTVSAVEKEGGWVARLVMPLYVKDECTGCHDAGPGEVSGAISVSLSLEDNREPLAKHERYFIVLGGVVFLGATASVLFTVRRRLVTPLTGLRKGAEALSEGDFSYRVGITSGDEMEEVGAAFDAMAARLHETTDRLKALSEKHSKLVEMAADAIILHEADTKRIVEANPAAEALTGYSRQELLGMDVEALYPKDRLDEYRMLRTRWLQDGKGYFVEAPIVRKDGSLTQVEVAASVVEFGKRVFLQEIWRDLSERKGFYETLRRYAEELEDKVEERTSELNRSLKEMESCKNELEEACRRLKESEKTLVQTVKMATLGELGAGIAHELNSPLAGILSITEVLLKRTDKEDPKHHLLEKIKDAAVRSKYIIEDLLTYSMPSRAQTRPTSLNDVVRATLSLFISEIKTKPLDITEEFDPDLPAVVANKGQLMEVFLNIMKNARDAMGGRGRLAVRTRAVEERGGRSAVVEVEDSGPGIPEEIRDRIFDPFFTTKEKGGGLNVGLGLSISHGIVKAHGGRIEVESEEGKGTLFRVILPAATDESA